MLAVMKQTILVVAMVAFTGGCGANLSQIADPMYEVARLACGNAEEIIIARDLPAEDKRAKIAQIRERCDPVFAVFEAIAGEEGEP